MVDFEIVINECDKRIEYILDNLELEYVKESDWVSIRCCFHNGEKFSLKYRNKSFFCFTQCKESYSIIDVTANVLDLSIVDASIYLSEILDVDCTIAKERKKDENLTKSNKILEEYRKIKKKSKTKYEPISQIFLNDIEPCYCKYISDWGISKETSEEFNLSIGLGGEMESRIVFPIDAPDGTIITLTGRMPNADKLGLEKYHKIKGVNCATTLYNISRATQYAKELGYIIVVEGMKSVLKLWEWGYKNVVASFGSSLSDEQAKILLKLGVDIVVIGDNDKAGKQLNQSTYNRCYKYLKVIQVDISEVTDIEKDSPDDLTKKKFEDLLTIYGLIDEVDF